MYYVTCFVFTGKPFIKASPVDENTSKFGYASFTCIAAGSPRPTIEWLKNNAVITSNSSFGLPEYKILVVNSSIGDCDITECAVSSTIVISNVTADDDAVYTCNASNNIGYMTSAAQLNINGNHYNYIYVHIHCC